MNHLFAALNAVQEMASRMERAGRDGRSPVSGAALTPLDHDEWQQVEVHLARLVSLLRDAVWCECPDRLAEQERADGRSATLFWLSVLLRSLEEEIVDDLHPDRMVQQYGPITSPDRERMAALADAMRQETHAIRRLLDGYRAAPKKGGSAGE